MGLATVNRQRSEKRFFSLLICVGCFGISLAIHFLFFQKTRNWGIIGFSPESYDTIVPRTFRMKRVEIDPKTLEDQNPPVKSEVNNGLPVAIEKEIPQLDQQSLVNGGKSILSKPMESTLPMEKPTAQIPSQGTESLLSKTATTSIDSKSGDLAKGDKNEMDQGVEEALKLTRPKEREAEGASEIEKSKKKGMQQFSEIDDLLASSGVLKKDTAPILMPTDLLFEYDSETLKPAAAETLTKLGSLIKKNALASFRIEGHTDSFGSDAYNNLLSLRRAEAVKNWLVASMGLDASLISTVGLGKSRLLTPASGDVRQQQLNRRVEIVISFPK